MACGIKTDDSAWCWGTNRHGVLGDGSGTYQTAPVQVAGNHEWISLDTSGADSAVCGITLERRGYCWGWGVRNGLGNGSTDEHDEPTPKPLAGLRLGRWVTLTVDLGVACGLQSDGSAWCWGIAFLGQGAESQDVPNATRAAGSTRWSQLAVGGLRDDEYVDNVICGIDSSGITRCWGDAYAEMIGDGQAHDVNSEVLTPRTVAGGHRFTTVWVGYVAVCALDDAHAIWCWGSNDVGNFGNGQRYPGNRPDSLVPVPGGFGHLWNSVSIDGRTCGIAVDGSAWCWGGNGKGDGGPVLPVEVTT